MPSPPAPPPRTLWVIGVAKGRPLSRHHLIFLRIFIRASTLHLLSKRWFRLWRNLGPRKYKYLQNGSSFFFTDILRIFADTQDAAKRVKTSSFHFAIGRFHKLSMYQQLPLSAFAASPRLHVFVGASIFCAPRSLCTAFAWRK